MAREDFEKRFGRHPGNFGFKWKIHSSTSRIFIQLPDPMKKIVFLLPVILFSSCTQPKEQATSNPEVDKIFEEWNTDHTPGGALAVVKDGRIIYETGYGLADLEHNVPIQPTTLFYCGSVSKQFVAMCILLLQEQGKLNLDDDIRKYFTDFPDYGYKLTIRNFIHHTSGVRDYLTLWDLAGRDYLDHISKYEVYDMIKRQKELNFMPGEKYLYSNSCYFMLSELVEKVSGKSLKDFAHDNIFQPLGMVHSHFHDNYLHLIPNRAFSYSPNGDTYNNLIMRFDQVGSGGLYSSVEDLFLWDQNFYHNKLGKGNQALIDTMQTDGKLNNGESAGYAFALVNENYRGLRSVSHSGSLAGYRAVITRFPDQNFSVIILSNISTFNPVRKAELVAEVYLSDKMDPVQEDKDTSMGEGREQKPDEWVDMDLTQYTGRFFSDELNTYYTFSVSRDSLRVGIANLQPRAIMADSLDEFSGEGGYLKFHFERNKKNAVTGFQLDAGRVQNLRFVKEDE